MSEDWVLQFDEVNYSYGGTPVLEDVNLKVAPRDFAWVVGPNGGGKTTLLKLSLGLLKPKSGKIRVFGLKPDQARSRVGYMPQLTRHDAQFPQEVIEFVLMGCLRPGMRMGRYTREDHESAMNALQQVGLADLPHRHFAALSGGQQRRLLIARALACHPELLLLDEPTANLDQNVGEELVDLLHRLNQTLTIMMVSHDPALVSEKTRSVVCVNRRVAIHPTREVDPAMMGELLRGRVRMVQHDHHRGRADEESEQADG
jgi:zinc transport system ATP-binding protein